MPTANGVPEPQTVSAGSLVCQHCGHLGPIQVGCAIVLGLAVMAGSDGAVHLPLPVKKQKEPGRWVQDARYSSRN
jgi:hypothetical protein